MCADPTVLGRPFYLMTYVDGWSLGGDWPTPFDKDLSARRDLAFQLVEGIALLGNVDWQAKGLQDFGRPDGFHERQVQRWTAFLARIKGREIPGFAEAAHWLTRHKPIDFVPGLMHGDYGFANVMFGHGSPPRLAAIIDWEMTTIGDPKLDLGWALSFLPADPLDPTQTGGVEGNFYGMPTRDAWQGGTQMSPAGKSRTSISILSLRCGSWQWCWNRAISGLVTTNGCRPSGQWFWIL